MGWGEFEAWLRAMKREVEAKQVRPDSWENSEHDPFWQQARRERDEHKSKFS